MSTEIVELRDFPGYGVDREGNVYSLERQVLRANGRPFTVRPRKLRTYVSGKGYHIVCLRVEEKKFSKRVHRLIATTFLDLELEQEVDHINRNPADNRLKNLRVATRSQNNCNTPGRGRWLKGTRLVGKRWQARIRINGENAHLGMFDIQHEAHAAYCKAAKELHGEFYCEPK